MQNFRVTDIQQLFNHHSSYTTHHTPLIIHYSSYTTHHTRLITPLIIHQSSYTAHTLALVSTAQAQATPAPGADFVAGAALCEPPCADFVAGAALCEPPCADVRGRSQHFVNLHVQISRHTKCTALCCTSMCTDGFVAGKYKMRLRRDSETHDHAQYHSIGTGGSDWQVKVCTWLLETVSWSCSHHSRIMLGILRPLGLHHSFTCFMK